MGSKQTIRLVYFSRSSALFENYSKLDRLMTDRGFGAQARW
jgi:hypothetical protein